MEKNKKVSVITGAASGMGRETALLFGKNGYEVICTDNDVNNLEKIVLDIKKTGGKAYGVVADITKVNDIKRLASKIKERTGKIHVLINCTGSLGSINKLVDAEEEDMDLILDVNFKGTYRCCKYLIPLMVKHQNSVIINIGSQSGKLPQPTASIYAAAKAAVINFTKSLELELKSDGIKVVVVNPGGTNTPFHDKRKTKLDKTFLEKLLNPNDISRACFFIAKQPENCIIKEMDVLPVPEKIEVTFE